MKTLKMLIAALFVLTVAVFAYAEHHENGSMHEEHGSMTDDHNLTKEISTAAIALINPTEEGSDVHGEVALIEVEGGVSVIATLSGVTPGKHGLHIHENGSCEDGGKAAGGHFNPAGKEHGLLPETGLEHAHAGDMGNIEIDENGQGVLEVILPGVSLSGGDFDVMEKAIILHAQEDDFSQPLGNAGGRIGCGIIGHAQ